MYTQSLFRTDTIGTSTEEAPPSYRAHFKLNASHLWRVEEFDNNNLMVTIRDPSVSSYWFTSSSPSSLSTSTESSTPSFTLVQGGRSGTPILLLSKSNKSSNFFTIHSLTKEGYKRSISTSVKNVLIGQTYHEYLNLDKNKIYVWKNVDLPGRDMICNEKNSINIVAYWERRKHHSNLSVAPGHNNEMELIIASTLGIEAFGMNKYTIKI